MLTLSLTTTVLLGVLLAAWLIGAVWTIVTGLAMRAAAQRQCNSILESS